jgi:hypothetical protein
MQTLARWIPPPHRRAEWRWIRDVALEIDFVETKYIPVLSSNTVHKSASVHHISVSNVHKQCMHLKFVVAYVHIEDFHSSQKVHEMIDVASINPYNINTVR